MSDSDRKRPEGGRVPSLTVDWRAYAHLLDASNLTDAQKKEFVETIWSIVVGFVDLGFPVNGPNDACGKDRETRPSEDAPVVSSLVNHWNNATNKSGGASTPPKPPMRTP